MYIVNRIKKSGGDKMEQYAALFEPLVIKRMTLKNRVMMPPMGTNFANLDGSFNNEHITYYEQRAKGGTGLITLENACLDFPMGTNGTTQLRIDNDQYLPGLWRFNEVMHAYGACIHRFKLTMQVLQLMACV